LTPLAAVSQRPGLDELPQIAYFAKLARIQSRHGPVVRRILEWGMSRLWLAKCVFAIAVLVQAGTVSADVTLSESNAPDSVLDAQLAELLGQENSALASVNGSYLLSLGEKPKRRSLRRKASGFSYDEEFLAGLPRASGNEQWRCLSEALYFEARGESVRGQFGVAEVILNRVDSPDFPDSVCSVIRQGTGRLFQCQFTYTCDGNKETVHDRAAWERVGKVARIMLDGKERELTGGATHYHTKAVRPRWSRVFPRTAAIGAHYFYRMPVRTAAKR